MDDDRDLQDLADLHRVLAGDPDAFRPIVERYADRILAFCRSRGLREDEAADASQEVFLRAYRSLGGFRIGSSFPAWLFAIAANRLRTRGAKRSGEERKIEAVRREEEAREEANPSTEAERSLEAAQLRGLVAGLPVELRRPVELYYFAELSVSDVARVLGLGEEAVKSRLFRARKRLRSLLVGEEPPQRRDASGGKTL